MTKYNLIALAIFSTTLLSGLEGAMAITKKQSECCKDCTLEKRPSSIPEREANIKRCLDRCGASDKMIQTSCYGL